jgi:multimeric flavodoxin WrbA
MKEAAGIVIGTPVYFFDVSAQTKVIIDRTFAMQPIGKSLANKVGGMVVTAGSMGTSDAVKCITNFFGVHRIFPVNWVAVYSPVHEKQKGMKAAYDLGREMVQFAHQRPEFPSGFSPNHITFGTHTH